MTITSSPDEGRSGPYESEDEALASPAVQGIYAAMRASRDYRMQDGSAALILGACQQAGVTLGAYDARIARWVAGFEPQAAAVIAGIIARAGAGKPGPHAVTFDLIGDDGTTYFVLQDALGEWAAQQRDKAGAEGGAGHRERWAARADELLAGVEAAMDGDR
jgi:hypothetical protein